MYVRGGRLRDQVWRHHPGLEPGARQHRHHQGGVEPQPGDRDERVLLPGEQPADLLPGVPARHGEEGPPRHQDAGTQVHTPREHQGIFSLYKIQVGMFLHNPG